MTTTNNAFAGFTTANDLGEFMVEQDPQTAFMTHLAGQQFRGTNPMQDRARDYFQGQYSNIYNRFLGDRGQEMKSQKTRLSGLLSPSILKTNLQKIHTHKDTLLELRMREECLQGGLLLALGLLPTNASRMVA